MPRSLFALVALFSLSGCVTEVVRSAPGTGPFYRVDATIEVRGPDPDAPHLVDFGQVPAGSFQEAEVFIRNVGTDTLQVQDLVLDAPGFTIQNEADVLPLLVPDESTVVVLRYAPVMDASEVAELLVASNDRETPEVSVTLRAEGLAPSVDIDPESFDFGSRELGCVGELPVRVSNVGRGLLTVDGLALEELSGSGELALDAAGITLPLVLQPGEFVEVDVLYVPTDVVPDAAQLVVESDDPQRPAARASWFGTAHLGESRLQQWAQDGNNATDILFVVDNSGSMGAEQASLATNFTAFAQIVEALDVDYQVGVVSTDLGDNGVLQGTTPIVTPNTPDPAGTFAANVNLGTGGSGFERGFDAAYLALTTPNIDPGGANQGFLRDGAGLRIIFVSDEQEQSSLVGAGDPASFVAWAWSLKPNPDHVVLSDITGGLTGCSGAGGSASTGSDYVAATSMTGGISASICDNNWSNALSALGWISQSVADTFELDEAPVPDTIEVRLSSDGLSFVPVYVGWEYDPDLNAIVFAADAVPDNGDFIEVEYAVLGSCEG